MDARALRVTALLVALCPAVALSATCRTENFVVTAPTPEFAKQVGEAAEYYRHHVAIAWLGEPLPGRWSQPCPIHCKVGQIGAGGATTFTFQRGKSGQMEVFGWNMEIQGTEQRILDSVLPHEISHMILPVTSAGRSRVGPMKEPRPSSNTNRSACGRRSFSIR